MSHLRSLLPRHFHTLRNLPNPSQYLKNPLHIPSSPTHFKPSLIASIFVRPISLLAQFEAQSISLDDNRQDNTDSKKPLHVLFKEAVGLSERTEVVDVEKEVGTNEFKKRLRKLEEEVRRLQEISSSSTSSSDRGTLKNLKKVSKGDSNSNLKSLYSLFANNAGDSEIKSEDVECLGMEDPMVYKKLSPEMVVFVSHLYEKGYFSNANFLPRNKFDVACFENSYGRDFVKYAAEKFGKDNQEIAKWLSASELKNVALFGCPSLGRKNIFSAKRLRYFFGIQEDTVCSKCVFKTSCKFVNQSVWKGDDKNLNLAVVMRVITLYALESVPPQLVVPDEIKESVSQLLKEVVNLSTTTLA